MLHRKVVHFVRISWDLLLLLAAIRRSFLQCKYTDFQRDPLSVKAKGLARISNVNILVMDNLVNVCFLSLIWPNSFRNYIINRLKTTKYRWISCIGVYRRIVKEFFMSLMSKCQNMPKYRFLKNCLKLVFQILIKFCLHIYTDNNLLVDQTHAGVQEVSSFRVNINLRVRYVHPVAIP